MTVLPLAEDIVAAADRLFSETDKADAIAVLAGATLEDGTAASPRLQRCALVASAGSLGKLRYYVDLLKIDYRDVIVAGEYDDSMSGDLVQVRDLNQPLSSNFRWSGP
jgi:hypothetical protein